MWSKIAFFLRPFLRLFASRAGDILRNAAIDAVRQVETDLAGASGEEKREAAFNTIRARLVAAGISISAQLIYAAIEIAVDQLKGA